VPSPNVKPRPPLDCQTSTSATAGVGTEEAVQVIVDHAYTYAHDRYCAPAPFRLVGVWSASDVMSRKAAPLTPDAAGTASDGPGSFSVLTDHSARRPVVPAPIRIGLVSYGLGGPVLSRHCSPTPPYCEFLGGKHSGLLTSGMAGSSRCLWVSRGGVRPFG
jgi:hypothetical protein